MRPGNYTAKALALVAEEVRRHPEITFDLIDPAGLDLPLPGLPAAGDGPVRLRRVLGSATGIILATPEYHGSFSSVIKLVIENLGFPSALAGKPVALLGVVAGQIGSEPSSRWGRWRAFAPTWARSCCPVLSRCPNVQKVFDPEGRISDPVVEKRTGRGALAGAKRPSPPPPAAPAAGVGGQSAAMTTGL